MLDKKNLRIIKERVNGYNMMYPETDPLDRFEHMSKDAHVPTIVLKTVGQHGYIERGDHKYDEELANLYQWLIDNDSRIKDEYDRLGITQHYQPLDDRIIGDEINRLKKSAKEDMLYSFSRPDELERNEEISNYNDNINRKSTTSESAFNNYDDSVKILSKIRSVDEKSQLRTFASWSKKIVQRRENADELVLACL